MSIPKQTYYVSSDDLVNISSDSPLTYVEWLQYETSFSKTDAFEQYSAYLNKWYNVKGLSSQDIQSSQIRNIYINLLKQIAVDYTTADEKRFLENIDYSNDRDLDIALPFFAKKLKQIALYYAGKRDELKYIPTKINLKGSEYGISQLVANEITDILRNDTYASEQLKAVGLTIQDVLANLDVNVVELYDTEQNYYNIPPTASEDNYTNSTTPRYTYFNMSNLPDSTKLFLTDTYNQAVIELIKEIPVKLQFADVEARDSENMSLAITDIVTGTELDRLDDSSFSDYVKNNDLNKLYEKLAFEKYSGTDYYYLSTGDTVTDTTSGQLFKAQSPHQNLLNKFYPTVLAVQGENLYREEFLGGFFTNTYIGLINYTSLDHTHYIEAKPNTVQYFPDPTSGARGYYGSYQLNSETIAYFENVNWHKHNVTNNYSFGRQKQYENVSRFTPYQSTNDSIRDNTTGVFRKNDQFNFWSNNQRWTNQDIFPKSSTGVQPISARQEQLLTGNKNIYKWKTDIYGNNYAIVKRQIDPEYSVQYNNNSTIYDTEYITNTTSPVGVNVNNVTQDEHPSKNLTDQSIITGDLYIRLNTDTGVQQLTSESISGIYNKYKVPGDINYRGETIALSAISSEIENSLLNFDIIYDTIIFDTTNYIIFEKISYDYENLVVKSASSNFAFVKKYINNNQYEHVSNWWLDESANRVLLSRTTVYPEASGTTSRMVYPEIYVYKISTGTLENAYPDPDYNQEQLKYETAQYSLSSITKDTDNVHDIIDVSAPKFTYNKDSQRFQTMQLGTDQADNVYLFKNDFRMYDNTIEYIKTSFYCNKYLNYTVNTNDGVIDETYFNETNTNIAKSTWFYDNDDNTLFMSCEKIGTDLVPVSNSSCTWTYGNNYFNFTGDRDIVITFDFAMSGTTDTPTLSANGLSVLFYKARKVENIKKYKGGVPNENFELLDDGGLGPSFSYFPDLSGTNTNPSLSGLDSAHAAVVLDNVGNIAGDITKPGDSVTTYGPYQSRDTYNNTVPLAGTGYSLWQDITGEQYSKLTYIRCKIVLTNLGREVRVYLKGLDSIKNKYDLISITNIAEYFPSDYSVPRRMKVSLASNTSSSPGIVAIKNISITGDANVDDSLVIIT